MWELTPKRYAWRYTPAGVGGPDHPARGAIPRLFLHYSQIIPRLFSSGIKHITAFLHFLAF